MSKESGGKVLKIIFFAVLAIIAFVFIRAAIITMF